MLLLIGIRVLYKIQQYGFLFTSESEISLYYRPEEYWSPYWSSNEWANPRYVCVERFKLSFQGWVRYRMNYHHSYIADHTGAVSRSQSIRNQKNIIKNKSEIRSILKMKNEKRTLPSSSCDPHPCLAPRNRLMASESFFLFFGYPWETPLQRYAWSCTPEYSIARHALSWNVLDIYKGSRI